MSRRKIVTPGKRWATDRRATRRYFLFAPDAQGRIAQAFWYTLAYYADKYGILVHAAILMSTHPHLVLTDPRGLQPLFKAEFHRILALCVKAIRGWPGEVFDKSKGGEHEPLTAAAMVHAIAYLIANGTTSFAVRYSKDWPGAKTRVEDIGRLVIRVARPDVYFDPTNPQWPDELELELVMPQILIDAFGVEGARKRIAEQVAKLEREAWQEAERRGISFKGARRATRVPHTARARGYETFGSLNPRFSAAGDREAAGRKVAELRSFDTKYDRALTRWTSGDRRHAVFPHGTWWMRVHHNARCEAPP